MMNSFYEITEVQVDGRPMIKIVMGTDDYLFSAAIPKELANTSYGYEIIAAWALGIAFIPEAGIDLKTAERLLDNYERSFRPPRKGLRRPKFRFF